MKSLINHFSGNDLQHYAGVAKQYNLLNDKSRHFLYDMGALRYHRENGNDNINFSYKQDSWFESILTEITSHLSSDNSEIKSCSLSNGNYICSRCIKLKKS